MKDILEEIVSKPITYMVLGFILFISVPELRIYMAFVIVVIFIATKGKNGFTLYFAEKNLKSSV
jgi:hypothetical protein